MYKNIKLTTIGWRHAKNIRDDKELLDVQEKLEMLYEFDGDGFLSKESKLMFMSLTIEGGN